MRSTCLAIVLIRSSIWAFDRYQYRWSWMTLNGEIALILRYFTEFGRPNGPYFALFHRIRVRCRRKTLMLGLLQFQNLLLIVYATPSPDWNCQWSPSGGRGPYSLYPRHVRASVLPKKETKYSYNAFRLTSHKSIYWELVWLSLLLQPPWNTGLPFGLFKFFNTKNTKSFIWKPRWNMISPVIFARGPDNFCWGPAPVGPTLVTGSNCLWPY